MNVKEETHLSGKNSTEQITSAHETGKMNSLQIAEIAGKQHSNVLKSIRKMEPAWLKVNGVNFDLVNYIDAKGEQRPMYELTKSECLYISTKFNDEARARLVIRWEELESKEAYVTGVKIKQMQASAKRRNEISLRIHEIDSSINRMMSERKSLIKERSLIDNQDYAILSFPTFPEWDHLRVGTFPNKSLCI
jgi:Rha family phage regulatory protein